MAPTAASRTPKYPRNRSPRSSNDRNMEIAINERLKTSEEDLRQLGAPMVCRYFGHGNESGRGRLPPVSISLHRKELLQMGHRGAFGRNCIATGQTTYRVPARQRSATRYPLLAMLRPSPHGSCSSYKLCTIEQSRFVGIGWLLPPLGPGNDVIVRVVLGQT